MGFVLLLMFCVWSGPDWRSSGSFSQSWNSISFCGWWRRNMPPSLWRAYWFHCEGHRWCLLNAITTIFYYISTTDNNNVCFICCCCCYCSWHKWVLITRYCEMLNRKSSQIDHFILFHTTYKVPWNNPVTI